MRRMTFCLFALGLAAGCSDGDPTAPNPLSYKHLPDMIRTALPLLSAPACSKLVVSGGIKLYRIRPDEDCYRLGPSRRMHGRWIVGFETSDFREDAKPVPRQVKSGTWLDAPASLARDPRFYGRPRLFQIELVGRSASFPGSYGHMGLARRLVVADRILSLREMSKSPEVVSAGSSPALPASTRAGPPASPHPLSAPARSAGGRP